MDVKVSVNLVNDDGRLKIALLESGCTVKSIGIHINGGASWLYQGVVDAFQKTILTTVENSVSKKMAEKMTKLDSLLQSLPKVRKIDDSVAVNLTFTGNPVLGDSSVEDRIDGLFMPDGEVSPPGGKAEEDDKYDGMTATREAEEEIGLDPSLVDVVTSLEPFLSKVGRKGPLSLWKEKGVRALRRHY